MISGLRVDASSHKCGLFCENLYVWTELYYQKKKKNLCFTQLVILKYCECSCKKKLKLYSEHYTEQSSRR